MQLREFLHKHEVPFKVLSSCQRLNMDEFSALEDACLIKTLLLSADHGYRYVVAALPKHLEFDQKLASHLLGGALLVKSRPEEMQVYRPEGTKISVSPFGSERGLLTIVDQTVGERSNVLCEDESGELLCFSWQDFIRIEHPLIGKFAFSTSARSPVISGT